MEMKKERNVGTLSYLQQMLITASIITTFIASLRASKAHSACNETLHIAISLFFHWKNPETRMFA